MKYQNSKLLIITIVIFLLFITTRDVFAAGPNVDITNKKKARAQFELACKTAIQRARRKIEQAFYNGSELKFEPSISFLDDSGADDTGTNAADKKFKDEKFIFGYTSSYLYWYPLDDVGNKIHVQYSIIENPGEGWKKSQKNTAYNLRIEAVAHAPGFGWMGMTQDAYITRTTLFMYQVFFDNMLEIDPNSAFELTGMIHTNEDLYLNSNDSLNIYTDSLTAAGQIYRGRSDKYGAHGHVSITQEDIDGSLIEMYRDEDSNSSNWEEIALDNWRGSVKDKTIGTSKTKAPKLQSFNPGGYYDKNAGINIKVLTSNEPVQYKITYNKKTSTYTSIQLNNALSESIIYDYRESPTGNKPVKVTNIDINKLKEILSFYPDNGLIYLTRDDAIADKDGNDYLTDPNRNVSGFKIINSCKLPAPTTFVSNLPVYIQGNYNKHTSNNPKDDKWQPSAIFSDAVTLLSNNWQDSKSKWKDNEINPSRTMPVASSGEYNSIFITGNLPSKRGQYNGGLENFPHLLENWSEKSLNIKGSFIQLFRSKFATGKWNDSCYISPEIRNWGTEERFNTLDDLPPKYLDVFPSIDINIKYSKLREIEQNELKIPDYYDK